jgi:DNA-binding NarL/FixJ family response regulator
LKRATILLADDYAPFFKVFRRLLEPEFEVIGTVLDGRALIEAAILLTPDVVVSDLSMPLVSGFDALRHLIAIQPNVRFIFLTIHNEPAYIEEALRAGAYGYVDKSRAESELVPAIRAALRDGEFFLSKLGT